MAGIIANVAQFYVGQTDPQAKKLVDQYKQAQAIRAPYEPDWRRVAELGLPRQYGGWVTTNAPSQAAGTGAARTARIAQFDSTLARAFPKFGAICERLMTPNSQIYHTLGPSNKSLLKSKAVTQYYYDYNQLLFKLRYHPRARFSIAQSEVYLSLAAYGNACKMITARGAPLNSDGTGLRRGQNSAKGGFLYRTIAFRNMYWMVDEDEQINLKFRRIDWTARQAESALGENCPDKLKEINKNANTHDQSRTWEFFQIIMPSNEYEPQAFDYRRYALTALYVFVEQPTICKQPSGYNSDPLVCPRHLTEGGSPYGYGAAQLVLSSVGTVNAQKKTMLKVGQKQADPPLLARDDGILNGNVDIRPAAVNYGGVDNQGRPLVHALQVGNLNVAEKLLEREQADIEDPFFVKLFEILKDRPQLTTTQVLDEAAKHASLVSPMMGRLQAEDQGFQIEREIDLCERQGLAPEKPAEILDDPEYDVTYTSPAAKMARSESTSGYFKMLDMAVNFAKETGDKGPLRMFNVTRSLPEIADQQNVPPHWMNTVEEAQAAMAQDAQAQKIDQATKALPGMASMARTAAVNPAQAGGMPAAPQ